MRLWLKGMLGWFDLLSRPPELSLHQQDGCLFLVIRVIPGAALLISFTPWLTLVQEA